MDTGTGAEKSYAKTSDENYIKGKQNYLRLSFIFWGKYVKQSHFFCNHGQDIWDKL